MKKEKEREEAKQRQLEEQKHLSSYLNRDQFNYFHENLNEMNKKMTDHSIKIDEIENKLILIFKKRKQRRMKQQEASDNQSEPSQLLMPEANIPGLSNRMDSVIKEEAQEESDQSQSSSMSASKSSESEKSLASD